MRIAWKLSIIVLLGILIQCGLIRAANEIDESAFAIRVFWATRAGMALDDPKLLDDAHRLIRRQRIRADATPPSDVERERLLVLAASDW